MTEFHNAVRAGDTARICEILKRDPSCVNVWDDHYYKPLHLVYRDVDPLTEADERLIIVKILLEYGADVNAQHAISAYTPLHVAISNKQTKGVEILLENGADPNLRDSEHLTSLHHAVISGNKKIIESLLQHGAEIEAVDSIGRTALDNAISLSVFDKAQVLLNVGVKARDIYEIALSYEEDESTAFFKFVLSNGAKMDFDGRFSIKALHYAVFNYNNTNNVKRLEKLLAEQGHDVESLKLEDDKTTELHFAAWNEEETQVQDLLKAGADVNAKNIIDETPLILLIDRISIDHDGLYRIAKLLIEAGADFNAQDYFNRTPFQMALFMAHSSIVNLMLAKYAGVEEDTLNNDVSNIDMRLDYDVESRNFFRTLYPLAVAIILGYEEIVDILIERQEHVEVTNNAIYRPPLYYAVNTFNYRITKMLLEAGSQVDEYYSYGLPILMKVDNDELELVCLLWEFDCFPILRVSLVYAFIFTIIEAKESQLISLQLFLYKMGLLSNKIGKDFIVVESFRSSERLTSLFASCEIQIGELKKKLVCGQLTKFDLLTMKLDSLVKFLNCEDNFKVCEELRLSLENKAEKESYEYMIKVRINLAIEKRRLLDDAKDCLSEALQNDSNFRKSINLPDEILYKILTYFNMRELKKLSVRN